MAKSPQEKAKATLEKKPKCKDLVERIESRIQRGEDLLGSMVRALVCNAGNAYYDYQKTRIAESNRVRSIVLQAAGLISPPGEKPPDKKKLEERALGEYDDRCIMAVLWQVLERLDEEEREIVETLLHGWEERLREEHLVKNKVLLRYLSNVPQWSKWLAYERGVGPVLTMNLFWRFGYCERFATVSKFWKFCGLHVENGKAPKREKNKKLTWNPDARTFAWKTADVFVKLKNYYRALYDRRKQRELARTDENAPQSRKHAHNRAMRYMVKIFLSHYWMYSRWLLDLPQPAPYALVHKGHCELIVPNPELVPRMFSNYDCRVPPWVRWQEEVPHGTIVLVDTSGRDVTHRLMRGW